ncbi:Arrestin-like protein [Lasiodiplodia theobromae]|uniref:Arrestin-like protein n=1 Tax=Lasiodiplodia theobromae TaxID=45133 RepID=A0A8H7MBW6_9PEZI|nr:Arrestin-like protein [Lasiodiplodia theobromae]
MFRIAADFGGILRSLTRLENKDIVFRRSHREGQKQILQGDVTFYTQSSIIIKSVKVILKAVRKVSWLTDSLQPQYVEQKECVLHQEQKLHVFVKNAGQASRAGPGLYIWPFAVTFSGDLPESVDWLPHDSYISYTLTAEVATGILWNTTSTTEHLRLIKSPSFLADDLDFAPEFRELIFPPDVTCQITLAQPYQPADGQLDLDFAFTHNQSNIINIENIAFELFQVVHLAVTKYGKPWSATKHERRIIFTAQRPNDTTAAFKSLDPEDDRKTIHFSVSLQLPLAPYTCVQSVEEENLKVRYKLRATFTFFQNSSLRFRRVVRRDWLQ